MYGITALVCVALLGLPIETVAQDTTTAVDPSCWAPWNVTVTTELSVSWTGTDRSGDVWIYIRAIDAPFGVKCIQSINQTSKFSEYEQTLPPFKSPCKGTQYDVKVTLTCDGNTEGKYDDIVYVPSDVPSVPRNISATADSISITVVWEEPSPYPGPVILYTVLWRSNSTRTYSTVNTTSLSYSIPDLTPLTTYFIRISATTEAGRGNLSPINPVRTKRPVAPERPRQVASSSRSIDVAWDEPPLYAGKGLIIAYSLQWTKLDTNESSVVKTTELSCTIQGLHPFTNYSIRIRAWTDCAYSAWSQPLIAVTDIGRPGPPENFNRTVSGRTIEVSWSEPYLYAGRGLITLYSLQWMDAYSKAGEIVNTTELAYKIDNLQPLAYYLMRLRAWTDEGEGDWTEYVAAQTEIGVPDAPENLRTTVISRSIQVTWTEPSLYAGRGFIIAYSLQFTKEGIDESQIENISETTYTIENLLPLTNYSIRVQAWTRDGVGAWTPYLTNKTEIGEPPPPENLRKGNVTDTSIEIMWDVPKNFKIYVTHHSIKWLNTHYSIKGTNDTTDSKFVLENLDPFTNYSISVRSWTKDGAGDWTVYILVQTLIGVPLVPRNITFTDIQQTSLKFEWSEPEPYRGPITLYDVQWGPTTWEFIQRNVTKETKFILRGLKPYTLYWVQVSASSYAGAGEWSAKHEERTAIAIPSFPRNLKQTKTTNTTIGIQWEEPTPSNGPITSYMVQWTNLYNGVTRNGTAKSVSHVITDLDPFTNYSIEVCAKTKAGWGEWSSSLIISTGVGVPSEPTGLKARQTTSTSIELEWNEPERIAGTISYYVLQWNNTVTGQRSKKKATYSNFTLKGLDPYTYYSIRIRAATVVGQGKWTEPQLYRTLSGVPGAPIGLRKVEATNSTIDITWKEPRLFQGPIVSYNVRWTHNLTQQWWTSNTSGLEYTIADLEAYTQYNIVVKAKTAAGFGPESGVLSVRTDIGVPTVPQNVSLVNKTAWSIEIDWSSPYPLNGPLKDYKVVWGEIERQTNVNFTNETYFEADNLNPYTNYSFRVSASTEIGYGLLSQPLILRTDIAVPNKPLELELTSSTNTSLSLKWKEPLPSHGPILGYFIRWCKLKDTANVTKETLFSNFSLTGLDPYANYSIQISAKTEVGIGSWTDPLVVSTQIGVPKPAVLRDVVEESSRSITVGWTNPNPFPGPTDYFLEVWRRPGQCDIDKEDSRELVLEGRLDDAEEWSIPKMETVENLVPYTQYYVRVVLKTSVGESMSDRSNVARTSPESPGAPVQVQADCNRSSTEVEVRWNPPVRANGKVFEYVVKYGVEHSVWNERIITATSQCREHRLLLQGLRPERKYRISVQAKVEGISNAGDEKYMKDYCVLPAGVPPMGNTQSVKVEASSSNQLKFVWSRDVFSNDMGSLVNYAILVGESESVGNASRGRSAELLPPWANFSSGTSKIYQATPLEWNPFEIEMYDPLKCEEFRTDDGVEIRIFLRCTVGSTRKCSSDEPYCNGPLRPETNYGLKIRAFTRGGYSETDPIFAKTGAVPGSSLVGGLVGGFLFLLIVSAVIVGMFILKRKGKLEELRMVVIARFRPNAAQPSQTSPQQVFQLEPYPAVKHLTAENFSEHVQLMMSDSHFRFSQEFEALIRNSPKFPCLTAGMEENRSKNRYLNIFPFDHSRVKLLPLGDDPESDFINANYIPGASSLREYIACQGPLNSTVDDMWRMVWEQASTMIVMLTQCVERGKNKCEQYWPTPAGEASHYGDIQVRTISESMLSSYIIRVFHLQLGSQERMVKQLHFTHWPDFGCPENPDQLINFIQAVRDHLSRIRPGPIVVHCSAGVGRTGTYITVDRLSQQLRHTDIIDIYSTVMELRHHRFNMVQTEDQYIYIHLCVKQLIDEMNAPAENEYEEAIYSNVGKDKDAGF